jgi:uncharacterized protein YcgL (UPF0745 family)
MDRVGLGKKYIILERRAKVSEVAEQLKNNFWYFINYKDELSFLQRETAYFYCFKVPSITPKKQTSFININISKSIISCFFDIGQGEKPKCYGKRTIIYINNRLAGELFINLKILNATDWTYSLLNENEIEELIKEIKNSLPFPEKSPQPPIYLGTDAEFELVLNEKIVRAENFIKDPDRKYAIGLDGSGAQIEFRPFPSDNIDNLMNNFKTLLSIFRNKYPKFQLSFTGNVYPLGAHIHFSLPPDSSFIKILDNWLGERLINFSGTARGNYKALSAYREQPHGFEYRSLPSFIFAHPALTYSVFKIAQKLAYYYYFDPEGVSLYPNPEEINRLEIQKEYQIIMNAHQFLKTNLFSNWKIHSQGNIIFTDTWSNEIVAFLINKLEKEIPNDITIHFFGFKIERGIAFNFDVEGFEKLEEFSVKVSENYYKFGIPYCLRTEPVSKHKELWEKIIEKIKEIIKKEGGEEVCA